MHIRISATRVEAGRPSGATCYDFRFDRHEILIGRSDAVDVCLPDPSVSLVHGRLLEDDGQWVYVDLESTNGSQVDGRPCMPREQVTVAVGSRIQVGPFQLRIEAPEQAEEETSARDTASFARQMILEAMQALGQPSACEIEVLSGETAGARTTLSSDKVAVIGRGEECDVRLDDSEISRRHAEIVWRADGAHLIDLGSKNGVLVGGRRVGDSSLLRDGDEVEMGNTRLRFHDPAAGAILGLQAADPGEQSGPDVDPPASARVAALEAVQSGELSSPPTEKPELSPASAFELGTSAKVLPAAQAGVDDHVAATSSRGTDILLFAIGAVLVVAGAALIVYLLL